MPNADSSSLFLRQLSENARWKFASKRYCQNDSFSSEANLMEYGFGNDGRPEMGMGRSDGEMRKRVMVVVDQSSESKHAMMWALTHVANKGDILTLLHIVQCYHQNKGDEGSSAANYLASSLGTLCKACKPEVEVEALVIQGPKLATVISQVKKLEVSVLVLGQNKSPRFLHCFGGTSTTEKFVEQCIDTVDCLTIGVRKQSKGIGGYLISTRWQKNFWLLA